MFRFETRVRRPGVVLIAAAYLSGCAASAPSLEVRRNKLERH